MSEGQPVPNNVVDDLLAEAMVAAAEKSKVERTCITQISPTPLCIVWYVWILIKAFWALAYAGSSIHGLNSIRNIAEIFGT